MSGEIQVVSFLTVSVAGSCIFYYIWRHLRFVREHERDLIAGAQLRMMLTQIRPHFLYNCLTAIEELCESDPKGAREAVSKFAGYLRGNMESLTRERSIPFTEEFAHTKLYLELEQMRFEDDLKLRFDIECTDFFIPALTLEPLAENAVRHGIRGREDGAGTVAITSREFPDRYEISVTDNGPGFDPSQLTDDGKTHIGIANVRERLKLLCQGRLQIDFPDEGGTRATIILPKKELQETDV